MNIQLLDLYSDYLLSSFSYTTATGLSSVLDSQVSHDKITRFLSAETWTSKDLWKLVKPTVREVESDDGILIFDDTIEEKMYTDENDMITWHFDHVFGRSVKGVNLLSCLYHVKDINIPVQFELIKKTIETTDKKTGKTIRKSSVTKNEMFRSMIGTCANTLHLRFSHVVADVWFSSNESMKYIHEELNKIFILPIKSNRLVAFSKEDQQSGSFEQVGATVRELTLEPVQVFLQGLSFPVLLLKQVFINEDNSQGVLYLVTNDLTATKDEITSTYQKRWNIEEYHKSIKSNASFAKSPTKTVRTQSNHFFASIFSYLKFELLKKKTRLNHFALKSKLYLCAIRSSMNELTRLRQSHGW
ncbi:MAG: transposase, partial [Candidatus Uhrbacteria bacterium]